MSDNPLAIVPWRKGELLPAPADDVPVIHIGRGIKPADPAPTKIETRTARREPGLEPDVFVPGAQAGITAVMVAIAVAFVSWAAGWSWKVTAVMFALSLVGAWLWRLRIVTSLLWTVETVTGLDFNGDGVKGQPQTVYTVANPHQARAAVAAETKQEEEDTKRAELLRFVDRCFMSGCPESAHGIKAGGPDRDKYIQQRDVLLSLGIATWKNPERPRAGWKLACSRQRARQILEKHVL